MIQSQNKPTDISAFCLEIVLARSISSLGILSSFHIKKFWHKKGLCSSGFQLYFPLNLYMHSPGGPSSFLNSLIETCQESSTTWSPNQCCTFEVFFTAVSHFPGPDSVPVICCCSVTKLCSTLCDPKDCGVPGFPVLRYLLEFAQTHLHWVDEPSNHLILCHPLFILPSVFPSIRILSNESALHQVAKVLELQF